jgi:muramidase (phage lysozyme)
VNLLDRATAGSNAEARAIQGYAAITERANTFRRRQNGLITEQIRLQQGLQPLADREAEVARRNTRAQSLRFQRDRGEQIRGRVGDATGSALIGGGFPLLFGQGAGAAAGGALGGVAGGAIGGQFGFGLSIVGTIVGDAFDRISVGAKDLAASLRDPSDALATLEAAGLKANTQLKFNIETLLAAGDAAGAQALVFQELNKRLGPEGVANLQVLNAAQKQLDEAWRELSATSLTTFLPAIISITNAITGLLNGLKESAESMDPKSPGYRKGNTTDQLTRLLGLPGGARTPGLVDASGKPLGMSAEDFPRGPRTVQPGPLDPNALQTQRLRNERLEDEQRAREKSLRDITRGEQDLGRQREDLERRVQDLRKQVLDRVFEQEQRIAGLRIDAARTEAQIRIEQNDQRLSGQISNFASEEGRALQEGIRQYIRTKSEGEADIEQKRKKADLDSVKLRRDQAKFEEQIAREVYSLQRSAADYERAVLDYRVKVADYDLDQKRKGEQMARERGASGDGGAGGIVSGSNAEKWAMLTRRVEGTAGPNGYSTLFGGGQFNPNGPHPDKVVRAGGYASTAAGAYQALTPTWRGAMGNASMTPANQDQFFRKKALERGVNVDTDPINAQNISKLAPEWAGFPMLGRQGGRYGQTKYTMAQVLAMAGTKGQGSNNGAPRPTFNPPPTPVVGAPSAEVTKSGGLVDKELAQQRELLGVSEKLVSVQNQGRLQALAQQITGNEKLVAGARLELQINQEIAKIDPNLTQSAQEQLELGIRQKLVEEDRLAGLKEALRDKGLTTAEQEKLNQAIDRSAQSQQQVNALARDNLVVTQETARARAFASEVDSANADNEALAIRLQALKDGNRELTASERVTIALGASAKNYTQAEIAKKVAIEQTTIGLERQLNQQQKMNDLYRGTGDIIRSGVGSALTSITDKTRTLNDVLADTLSQLGNLFIQFAVNSAFDSLGKGGGILGSLFKRAANGGNVSAGEPIFVGDNKDGSLNSTSELFIPGISGYVASSTDVQAAVRSAVSTPMDPEASGGMTVARAAMERSMMASEQNYQAAVLGEMANSPIKIESRGMRADELPFITMEESDRRTAEAVKQAVKISDAKWRQAAKNEVR